MKNESNIFFYLRFREIGALNIYFKNKVVVFYRPNLLNYINTVY